MKTIVITYPDFFEGEANAIEKQLTQGAWRVHVRKPGCTLQAMRNLIEAIPLQLRGRMSLHDCHELAPVLGVGGVHLNSRNQAVPEGWTGLVSRSCHSIAEAEACNEDYCFLSPVFDSISKPGYRAAFAAEDLRRADLKRVYALGGVTVSRLAQVESLGFGGAAMLGAAWNVVNPGCFKFQFITHDNGFLGYAQGARMALEGGCRWIQLRMKEATAAEFIRIARQIEPLCRRHGATFLLDDHVELVREAGADGVHVGKNDMPVAEAKRLLGPGFIVGATANSFEDICRAASAGADYVGLGPYRFTTTKKRLSPVLGLEGYRNIMSLCRKEGLKVPVVAIGGITASDVPALINSGVGGVAVSGAILNAVNPITETQKICQLL